MDYLVSIQVDHFRNKYNSLLYSPYLIINNSAYSYQV
jgi:hypothetical protein